MEMRVGKLGIMPVSKHMVKLTQDSKYPCKSGGKYGITFYIICEENANRLEPTDFLVQDDFCHPTIIVKHSAGCPKVKASGIALWGAESDPVQVVR